MIFGYWKKLLLLLLLFWFFYLRTQQVESVTFSVEFIILKLPSLIFQKIVYGLAEWYIFIPQFGKCMWNIHNCHFDNNVNSFSDQYIWYEKWNNDIGDYMACGLKKTIHFLWHCSSLPFYSNIILQFYNIFIFCWLKCAVSHFIFFSFLIISVKLAAWDDFLTWRSCDINQCLYL